MYVVDTFYGSVSGEISVDSVVQQSHCSVLCNGLRDVKMMSADFVVIKIHAALLLFVVVCCVGHSFVFGVRCSRCEKSFITSVYVSPSPVPCSWSPISSFSAVRRNLRKQVCENPQRII